MTLDYLSNQASPNLLNLNNNNIIKIATVSILISNLSRDMPSIYTPESSNLSRRGGLC